MRPTTSYLEQGMEAYRDGVEATACPHDRGAPKALQWEIGWLRSFLRDPLACDDDLDELFLERDERLARLESEHRSLMRRIGSDLAPAKACAKRIGIPLRSWPGNCYAISAAVLKSGALDDLGNVHGAARVSYGLYTGPIAETGRFAGRGISHHGWIEFDSGLVVDPTAWAFTDTAPVLLATTIENYDLAGSRFLAHLSSRPVPDFYASGKTFAFRRDDEEAIATARVLLGLDSGWDGRVGLAQMMWLANLPLEQLAEAAKPIYRAIATTGNAAMIPIDNRLYVDEALPDESPLSPVP